MGLGTTEILLLAILIVAIVVTVRSSIFGRLTTCRGCGQAVPPMGLTCLRCGQPIPPSN